MRITLKANKLYKLKHNGIKIGEVQNVGTATEFTPLSDCIILCPKYDREIDDSGCGVNHMIDCLFLVTFTLRLSMGGKTVYYPSGLQYSCHFEKLTAVDYLTVAHLLTKTKYRYDIKTKTIIDTEK